MSQEGEQQPPKPPRHVHPDATPFRPPTPEEAVMGMGAGSPTMAHQNQQHINQGFAGGNPVQRFGDSNQGMMVVPMQGTTMRQAQGADRSTSSMPPEEAAKIIASQSGGTISHERALAAIHAAQGGRAPVMEDPRASLPANTPSFSMSTAGLPPLALNQEDPRSLTPQRRVEMLQRNIEFTQRLIGDTARSARNARITMGFEFVSFSAGLFLFMFGIRKADPTKGLLKSFAASRPHLARLGSIYCMAGSLGMSMTVFFLPMEYQAVKNTDFALHQLERTQRNTLAQRDELLHGMAIEAMSKSEEKK